MVSHYQTHQRIDYLLIVTTISHISYHFKSILTTCLPCTYSFLYHSISSELTADTFQVSINTSMTIMIIKQKIQKKTNNKCINKNMTITFCQMEGILSRTKNKTLSNSPPSPSPTPSSLVFIIIAIISGLHHRLVVWLSGNALVSINVVTLRRARLLPGWVTVFGQVNYLSM